MSSIKYNYNTCFKCCLFADISQSYLIYEISINRNTKTFINQKK